MFNAIERFLSIKREISRHQEGHLWCENARSLVRRGRALTMFELERELARTPQKNPNTSGTRCFGR